MVVEAITMCLVLTDYILTCIGTILFMFGYSNRFFPELIKNEPEIVLINKLIMCFGITVVSLSVGHSIAVINRFSRLLVLVAIFHLLFIMFQIYYFLMVYKCIDPYCSFVSSSLQRFTDDYHNSNSTKLIMDKIQETLECCGANGPSDWKMFDRPTSCCVVKEKQCELWLVYAKGCIETVAETTKMFIQNNYWYFIWSLILQLDLIMLTCYELATMEMENAQNGLS